MREHGTPVRIAAFAATSLLALAACDDRDEFDVSSQIGPDPVLPEPRMPLIANVKVAEVVGWQEGETPDVPDGLVVTAYATDLANPRTVHTLPNGDVLVVQGEAPPGKPVERPKDLIRDWIMAMARGGGGGGGGGGEERESNLITLLRDTDRDGNVDERSDLLTDLNSPFGVAWAEGTLYVAAADAVLPTRTSRGRTRSLPSLQS
jgi:glucose/arabinose dehydrogenase